LANNRDFGTTALMFSLFKYVYEKKKKKTILKKRQKSKKKKKQKTK